MRVWWMVGIVVVAACKRGPSEIKSDVHRNTTMAEGLPHPDVTGTFADTKPALAITGVTGALADGMKRKLAGSIASKGNVSIDVTDARPASPGGDGTYTATLVGKALFARPPHVIKLEGTIDVKLSFTNTSADELGEALGDIVLGWFADEKLPDDVGLPPGPVPPIEHVAAGQPDCALGRDGSVRCWSSDMAPVLVATANDTTAIDAAQNYGACGVRKGGAVYCIDAWDNTVAMETRDACGIANATSVSVGDRYACAIVADGQVSCWGRSPEWFAPCDHAPGLRTVQGIKGAVELAVDAFAGCARSGDGSVACWPMDVDAKRDFTATRVKALDQAREVLVHYTGCGVLGDARVKCVGDKTMPGADFAVPARIKDACAGHALCAATDHGDVYCGEGQLAPVVVPGVSDIVQIDCELGDTCGLTSKGKVVCWGGMSGDKPPRNIDIAW